MEKLFQSSGRRSSCHKSRTWCVIPVEYLTDRQGIPLPADFSAFTPENFYAHREPGSFDSGALPSVPSSFAGSRRPSSPNALGPNDRSVPPPLPHRVASPLHMGGPGYANLPNHSDDIRRLVEECTAARESARVLAEALVFTRPHELDSKPIIRVSQPRQSRADQQEFYRKCFLAHESLTNQIDWAQAEAYQSRERAIMDASAAGYAPAPVSTPEEQALGTLFEAHGQLAEALKQHDDMERLAVDDAEMREVRERSKKETRMDRNVSRINGMPLICSKAHTIQAGIFWLPVRMVGTLDRLQDRHLRHLIPACPRRCLHLDAQIKQCPSHDRSLPLIVGQGPLRQTDIRTQRSRNRRDGPLPLLELLCPKRGYLVHCPIRSIVVRPLRLKVYPARRKTARPRLHGLEQEAPVNTVPRTWTKTMTIHRHPSNLAERLWVKGVSLRIPIVSRALMIWLTNRPLQPRRHVFDRYKGIFSQLRGVHHCRRGVFRQADYLCV